MNLIAALMAGELKRAIGCGSDITKSGTTVRMAGLVGKAALRRGRLLVRIVIHFDRAIVMMVVVLSHRYRGLSMGERMPNVSSRRG